MSGEIAEREQEKIATLMRAIRNYLVFIAEMQRDGKVNLSVLVEAGIFAEKIDELFPHTNIREPALTPQTPKAERPFKIGTSEFI